MGFTIHNRGQGKTIRGLAFVATLVIFLFASYHLYYFPNDLANVVVEGEMLYEKQLGEIAGMKRVDPRGNEILTLQVKGMQNQEVTEDLGKKGYRVSEEIRDPQGSQVLLKKHRNLGPEEIKLLLNAQVRAIPVESQPKKVGKENIAEKATRRKLPANPESWKGMTLTLQEDVWHESKIFSLDAADETSEKALANAKLTPSLLSAMIKAGIPEVQVRDEGEVEKGIYPVLAGFHLTAAEAVVKETFWSRNLFSFPFLGTASKITLGLVISVIFFLVGMAIGYLFILNRPAYADFLIEVESEMRKVTWPTWNELTSSTMAVLVTVVFMGCYLYVLDILINGFMQKLIYAAR